MSVRLLDVVVLRIDVPSQGLRTGMRGTVVAIHERPRLAYEVEFCDEREATLALVALTPDQVVPAALNG